jgi:hypothetical protein
MRRRVVVLGALGGVATGLGLALLLAPGVVRSVGPLDGFVEAAGAADPKLLMLVAGLGVTGYVMLAARSNPTAESSGIRPPAQRRFERAGPQPPGAVTAARRRVAAASVDGEFEVAVENGGRALREARAHLAAVATDAYAVTTGQSREAARDAVANGTWTDDPVAALFLSEGGRPPRRARLALWLRPRQERRRRIERTVAAVERLAGEP